MKNLPTDPERDNVPSMLDENDIGHETPGTTFLAFSGKKQVGKDLSMGIAKELLEASGKTVQFAAFADTLKNKLCIDILGLDHSNLYGSNEDKEKLTHILWDTLPEYIRKKYSTEVKEQRRWQDGSTNGLFPEMWPRSGPMTYREVMQVVGTDIFRAMIYDPVWVNATFRRKFLADVVIISDLRFPNEKTATEERGGIIIRLERDTGLIDNHSSETALDNADFKYKYSNNGSLDDLKNYILNVLKENELL